MKERETERHTETERRGETERKKSSLITYTYMNI